MPPHAAAAAAVLGLLFLAPMTGYPASAPLREPLVDLELVPVAGGTFMMGDWTGTGTEKERPLRPVTVSDFHLSSREVTVRQFRIFTDETGYRTDSERAGGAIDIDLAMNSIARRPDISWRTPGFVQEEGNPVVWVSWNDAQAFVSWLAKRTGRPYRLPTEAQWEYAAREGGRDLRWAGTSNSRDLYRFAWYFSNSGGRPHAVGSLEPNALGLHDLSGNVWEWCLDWQAPYGDSPAPLLNPRGPGAGSYKSLRGGSWRVGDGIVTTTYRNGYRPDYAHSSIGFRVALPGDEGPPD